MKEAGMAIAVIQDWIEPETERSTTNYDAISAKLMAEDEPIDGLRFHCAGFTGTGFRIFEVWDTAAHFERFTAERMPPLISEVGPGAPPAVTTYELHAIITP
jgi:hypothetical protein